MAWGPRGVCFYLYRPPETGYRITSRKSADLFRVFPVFLVASQQRSSIRQGETLTNARWRANLTVYIYFPVCTVISGSEFVFVCTFREQQTNFFRGGDGERRWLFRTGNNTKYRNTEFHRNEHALLAVWWWKDKRHHHHRLHYTLSSWKVLPPSGSRGVAFVVIVVVGAVVMIFMAHKLFGREAPDEGWFLPDASWRVLVRTRVVENWVNGFG